MSLSEQLSSDLKQAMLSGDTRRRDVIRYLRAGITNAEIERRRPLTDDEIQEVIRHQIKQRRDSIDLYRKGNRDDLADEEAAQITILEPYLPPQLSDDELRAIVGRAADRVGASSQRDMGKLIPVLLAEVGDRAEGRRVSEFAREELSRRARSASAS